MSHLFSPLTIRSITFPNRIVVSPMCQYCVEDGIPAAWHMMHLLQLAISGAGMLTIESTAVEPEGRITSGDLGLWGDEQAAGFAPILAAIREHSRIPITLQLAHAGRKASSAEPWNGGQLIPLANGGWDTYAPSPIPQKEGESSPIALDTMGLQRIRDAFAAAAIRAEKLGVDCIEIHAGHGYLIHQFLSPISNRRTDKYGGTFENRIRFPLEIFDAIRDVFPKNKPVGIKLSASDWIDGGWDIAQSVALSVELKNRNVDWIVASSGGISPFQKIVTGPGYQVPFADAIRQGAGVITTAVGLITEPKQAEEILEDGHADFVAIARAMLYDPRWPWRAAERLGATIEAPPQYWRAPPAGQQNIFDNITFGAR